MKNSYLATFLSILVMVLSINTALADTWFYKPIFHLEGLGETNRQLRTSDEKGTAGGEGRAGVQLSSKSETSELFVRGILHSERYDGGDERGRDSDDQLFYAGGNWRGERSSFSMNGQYLRQSTSITELEDTGNVQSDDRKVTTRLAPQFNYSLFEDIQVFAGLNYTDVEFPNATPVNTTEYDVKGGNGGVVYTIDELNSITFTGYYSEYEADTFTSDVDSVGGNIRYNKTFNERWQGYVGLGYRKSNYKFINNMNNIERDSDTGETYELGFTYQKSELERLTFRVVNQLQPSSSGNVNDRLEFRSSYRKQLSPRITGVANLLWLENESVNDDSGNDNREYWQSIIGLDYRLTEMWSLTGRYRHREQEYVDRANSSKADSDAILIGIRFNGRDKRI